MQKNNMVVTTASRKRSKFCLQKISYGTIKKKKKEFR